jgi:hypothetical protein
MANESFSRSDGLRLIAGIAWLALLALWPRPTFAATLLIIGGVMLAYNAMIFWAEVVRGRDASSVVPVFGGIVAAAGVALLPIAGSWHWAWVPLLLDWGGMPRLLAAMFGRSSR